MDRLERRDLRRPPAAPVPAVASVAASRARALAASNTPLAALIAPVAASDAAVATRSASPASLLLVLAQAMALLLMGFIGPTIALSSAATYVLEASSAACPAAIIAALAAIASARAASNAASA